MNSAPYSDRCCHNAEEIAAVKKKVVQLNETLIGVVQRVKRMEQAQVQGSSFQQSMHADGSDDFKGKAGDMHTASRCKHCLNISANMTDHLLNRVQNGDAQIQPLLYRPPSAVQRSVNVTKKFYNHHLVSTAYVSYTAEIATEPEVDLLKDLITREEDGQLVVAGFKSKPAVYKHLLNIGDVITSVNGSKVYTAEELEKHMQYADNVRLQIVPAAMKQLDFTDVVYLKCLFDFDAKLTKGLPSDARPLEFKIGDVLEVLNQADVEWWQARKVGDWSNCGVIPSISLARKCLKERMTKGSVSSDSNPGGSRLLHDTDGLMPVSFARSADVPHSGKNNKPELEFYEEVVRATPYGRRVLILLGAKGVGRRTLKSQLITHDPVNFAVVVPYTSRSPREGEQEGREYHFIKKEKMKQDIDAGIYIEWGEYNSNYYGTTYDSIRKVIQRGQVCVVDSGPQVIHRVRNGEFMPYVVLISPPPFEELKQIYSVHLDNNHAKSDEELKRTCDENDLILHAYRPFIDLILVNRNPEVTFRRLVDATESLKSHAQWVPLLWMKSHGC